MLTGPEPVGGGHAKDNKTWSKTDYKYTEDLRDDIQ
jgi:hypothetical protein